jgi:hypothetical protein
MFQLDLRSSSQHQFRRGGVDQRGLRPRFEVKEGEYVVEYFSSHFGLLGSCPGSSMLFAVAFARQRDWPLDRVADAGSA